MKKIISVAKPQEVRSSELKGNEVVAYRSKNSENYCILAKLVNKKMYGDKVQEVFGFVPLGSSSSEPRFVSDTWQGAIEVASQTRSVFMFETWQEMLQAMLNKRF
jgi:hypothetical protein